MQRSTKDPSRVFDLMKKFRIESEINEKIAAFLAPDTFL